MERKATPPSTPPWAMMGGALSNKSNSTLPTTPPAIRKYSTGNLKVESALIKSTSHESQLGHKLTHPSASDLALVGSYLPVSAASNCENPPTMCGDQSRPMVSSSMASSITSNLNSAVYRYVYSKVKGCIHLLNTRKYCDNTRKYCDNTRKCCGNGKDV